LKQCSSVTGTAGVPDVASVNDHSHSFVGLPVGLVVGVSVCPVTVGLVEGLTVGEVVGFFVGLVVGFFVGLFVGLVVGLFVGLAVTGPLSSHTIL
jgi:hypothetical protein